MDTEDWILNGTKLITNTKKQILKIYSKSYSQKYNFKRNKKNNKDKIYIYIYEVCGKNRVFFFFAR